MTLKVKLKLLRDYIVGIKDTDHVVDWTKITVKKLWNATDEKSANIVTNASVKFDVAQWSKWNGDPTCASPTKKELNLVYILTTRKRFIVSTRPFCKKESSGTTPEVYTR